MHKHLFSVTLALALLPTASASDTPVESPAAFAAGRVIDSGHVQLTITFGGQQSHGEVVPLCQEHPPVQAGAYVLGISNASCFQVLHVDTANPASSLLFQAWTTSVHVDTFGGVGPIPVCIPVGGSIFPDGGPPVVVRPDHGCIEAIRDEIFG